MKFARFLIASALLLASTSVLTEQVRSDYDHNVNFSQFHTYYWAKVQTENPLWQARVEAAVDKDLQSKGWQRVNSGGQVALTAVGATHNQQQYQTFYENLGPGWWWGGFGTQATTTVQNYRTGTLVLDMYDAQNKHLIWRGTAADMLSDKPEKNQEKLDKAVDKLLEHFPPSGR
jgi:hypothetical protein